MTPSTDTAQLALDTILHRPGRRVPSWMLHVMEHALIERLAGAAPGDYRRDPEHVYLAAQRAAGTCLIDQYIPTNPLSMGGRGWQGERSATTGADGVECDGIRIVGPEAVVEHLERFEFPRLRAAVAGFDEGRRVGEILAGEAALQEKLGPAILKTGYGFVRFPYFAYGTYGYAPYFMAMALYPEVLERHFSLQADLSLCHNRAAAHAYVEGGLPPLYRLDHDIADSRGTLADPRLLDRIWLPHFARCLEPVIRAGVRLVWHCDGNLMAMVPRLIEAGVKGFQGFQYEDGMEYPRICALRARDGDALTIIAGVSVTRTLPLGTPAAVRREIDWLVANGPPTGLFLGASSSIVPGTPWENIRTLVEGLRYYREKGR